MCETHSFVNRFSSVALLQQKRGIILVLANTKRWTCHRCFLSHERAFMNKILIVEDDADIAKNLELLLAENDYETAVATGQKAALEKLKEEVPDLVLLDISLPDGNGYSLCTLIKQQGDIPVIFLTASSDEASTVTGLELGADDYISKPFRSLELISRIKAALRKSSKGQRAFCVGDLKVDTVRGTVMKGGEEVILSALEYRLLLVFINNKGAILTRDRLMNEIWDIAGEYITDNTLTVYIKRLRSKIESDPQNPAIIQTIRGLGYRLD